MEVVNFSETNFHDIDMQDNPAYGKDECIMIVESYEVGPKYAVLHIIPVDKPLENESVTDICDCYALDKAIIIAEHLANVG